MSRSSSVTDVFPDDRLSRFLLDVRYIATFCRGEHKEGQAESQPAITKGCLEEPIGSVRRPEFDTRLG